MKKPRPVANSEADKQDAPATPGDILRAAREMHDYSRREMADRLNWRHDFVEAVEENRFEILRGATFVSGYLRTYARILDVPEDDVIRALKNFSGEQLDSAPRQVETRLPQVQRHGFGVPVGVAAALLLVVAMWWLGSGEDGGETGAVERAQPSAEVDMPAVASVPPTAVEGPDVEPAEELPMDDESVVETAAAAPSIVEPVAPAAIVETPAVEGEPIAVPVQALVEQQGAEEPAEGEETLTFRFSKDCWLEVRDVSGDLVYADLRRPGNVLNVRGVPPFKILVGDASAVELRFRDGTVDIPVRPGRTTSRFTVGE